MDPLFFMIMNVSNTIPQPKDKDTPQLDSVASDVYGFPSHKDEQSGVFVQVNNIGDGRESIRNSINFGWHVNPRLYGDSKAHFYVYWTRDGYKIIGCYNLQCPDYVPEPNVPTVLGIAIDAVSDPNGVKRTIIFKIFKDNAGDWLMHIGFDSEPYCFPKSLFTSLGDKVDNIRLGGFVATRTTQLARMGSGFLPNNAKSASFSNIQLIDQNGETRRVPRDQPIYMNVE
ncbi:hypothetical protein SETIT_5G380400v2 [Setaria italica]|uniref:Neprosin PEP catalytic domain-containing protein n=1 Tax=Setaria italica TaxID=4555 RepID=A0A368RDH3_SETIT|nr:hypothetical protein SETIT_5G380400v2 [Setaria italica]